MIPKKIIKNVTRPIAENYYYVFDTSAIMGLDTQKSVLYFFEVMDVVLTSGPGTNQSDSCFLMLDLL